jgi:hypothetical protein
MSSPIDWLLEPDPRNPSVRFFALTDILEAPVDDPEVISAQRAIMESGPVPAILAAQHPAGYWEQPGPGYYPKYRGTVWSMIYLAQLGACGADARIRAGGEILLSHAVAATGVFSMSGSPSGSIACLAGNLGAALLDLGFETDQRLRRALEMTAREAAGPASAVQPTTGCPAPGVR